MRLFSQQGVSGNLAGTDCSEPRASRGGGIYWHFKDKSDLFGEIWELSESSINMILRVSIGQNSLTIHSVLREILVYIPEATVVEERRRLMMEIIFHKCEFVGRKWRWFSRRNATCVWKATIASNRSSRVHAGQNASCTLLTPPDGDPDAQLYFRPDGKLALPGVVRSQIGALFMARHFSRDVPALSDPSK